MVLSEKRIRERLFDQATPEQKRLYVTPILDPERQIKEASIDVRLGNEFIVTQQTNLSSLDPSQGEKIEDNIERYQNLTRVQFGQEFILHPSHLVLGCTLEYVSMPTDLACQVLGRSSWGRLGLIIATATTVSPGFKGSITLELVNFGPVPIMLHPGVSIAQLVFEEVDGDAPYVGRYNCPTGPQFSRIHRDDDVKFWASYGRRAE